MAITVNIPDTATASIDNKDEITINLRVQIMDGATVLGDTTLSVKVFLYTANVRDYAVSLMIAEINRYKALMTKNKTIQAALTTFTAGVIAGV